MVLEHASMTDFCGIPLVSLRENTITELDLNEKGVGVPGAIVLSKLLPSAAAVKSLKCAAAPRAFAFVSAPTDTRHRPLIAVCSTTRSAKARMLLCPPPSRCRRS